MKFVGTNGELASILTVKSAVLKPLLHSIVNVYVGVPAALKVGKPPVVTQYCPIYKHNGITYLVLV